MRTARGRRLAAELKQLREGRGLSPEDAITELGVSRSTVQRIEKGEVIPQRRTLDAMLALYGASNEQRSHVHAMAKGASSRAGWLHTYRDLIPDELADFISFEMEAATICTYEASLVPGLLQTVDYARAVNAGILHFATPDVVDRRVEVRMKRQAILTREHPVRLEAVIDEATLWRAVGGRDVMAAQLSHLRDLPQQVDLRVIPFNAGAHPGMLGPFVVMYFDDDVDDPLVYSESMAGEVFLEADADVKRFATTFRQLRKQALSEADSALLIEAAERRYLTKGKT
jgi:transcriptional regulator with XRE-family HTH domain